MVFNERSLLPVPRVVLSNHVDFFARPNCSVAKPRHKDIGAALDLHDVSHAGDAPQPVAIVSVHGFVGSHPGPHVVGVALVQVGIEKIYHWSIRRPCWRRSGLLRGGIREVMVGRSGRGVGHVGTILRKPPRLHIEAAPQTLWSCSVLSRLLCFVVSCSVRQPRRAPSAKRRRLR